MILLRHLLIKDKSFTIHHQNIQFLAIEIYKAIHNLPGGNIRELFVRNNHNYNLGSKSERKTRTLKGNGKVSDLANALVK